MWHVSEETDKKPVSFFSKKISVSFQNRSDQLSIL
jgi:hypothetical protein